MAIVPSQQIRITDTTLRDGHQQPGNAFSYVTRLAIARSLADMGVDTIEAGFPANNVDFEPVQTIAREVTGSTISALARVVRGDIDAAYKALKPAIDRGNSMVHVFIGTSEMLRDNSVRKNPDELQEIVGKQVSYAKSLFPVVQFSPEDAARTEPGFLRNIIEIAIKAGATIINVPDTVGYAQPREYASLIASLFSIPEIKAGKAIISAHCHNDLGLASANTLEGIISGVRQVEGTILGMGERAGNAHWPEVVMALKSREQYFEQQTGVKLVTGVDSTQFRRISQEVAQAGHVSMPRNFPVVGDNAFRHSSGIHANAMIRNPGTYQIMTPEGVGQRMELVFGPTSGRALTEELLKKFGYTSISTATVDGLTEYLKKHSLEVEDSLAYSEVRLQVAGYIDGRATDRITNPKISLMTGNSFIPTASIKMQIDGTEVMSESRGVGVFDALVNAVLKGINGNFGKKIKFVGWEEIPINTGQDAEAYARVYMNYGNELYVGRAKHTDIALAAGLAAVNAINGIYALNKPSSLVLENNRS